MNLTEPTLGWIRPSASLMGMALWLHATAPLEAAAPTEPVKTGLQLWLRADAGVTTNSTGAVTAWSDQSGQGNHAAQIDPSMAPLWVGSAVGGKPALRFDGDNDYLEVSDAPTIEIVGDIASFAVVKFDDYTNYREIWGKTAGPSGNLPAPNDWYLMQNTGVSRVLRGDPGSSNGAVDSSAPVPAGQYLVLGFSMSGTVLTQYRNGYSSGSGSITAPLVDGGTSLRIGSREDLFTKMKGDIAEVLIYDSALSRADIDLVFDYLLNKYGLIAPEGLIASVLPAPKSAAAAPNLVQIAHRDGVVAWTSNNVTMKVDGDPVAPAFVREGSTMTLTYMPAPLFSPQSQHTVTVEYPDASGSPLAYSWSFTVAPYTKDRVQDRVGVLRGGSSYTASGGGHTGKAGDYGVDFTAAGTGPVYVGDATFLNPAGAQDELAFAFWAKKYDIASGSAFWANAPSAGSGTRGFQAHVPWDNDNIYFDTSGCCDADTQRINEHISYFPDYTGDDAWWTNWHYFVFSKKADVKQIWIDGQLFLEGFSTAPLPSDFTDLYLGSDGTGAGLFHAIIDDFTVFSAAPTEADVQALFGGAVPTGLPASKGLLAYWDFNDIPAQGLFVSVTPAPDATNASPNLVRVVHMDGTLALDPAKVGLKIDGATVSPIITKTNNLITVSFVPAPAFAPYSSHSATLSYDAADIYRWQFAVGVYARDSVASRVALPSGSAKFSADQGGQSGKVGDYAIDLVRAGGAWVSIADGSFLNAAAANDELSVAIWIKKYDIASGSAFWMVSPSSSNGQRGFQAHTPWSDDTVYFDTAGCCDAGVTRISAPINTFSPYLEVGDDAWWTNWHHFVFTKKGDAKNIYIDGQLFLYDFGSAVLPTDFTSISLGTDGYPGGNFMHGLLDDFAIFGSELTEANAKALANRTVTPAGLTNAGLLAYWNFNEGSAPPATPTLSFARTASGLTITFTGTLQSASSVTGPWTDVGGASSPYAVAAGSGQMYFKARN